MNEKQIVDGYRPTDGPFKGTLVPPPGGSAAIPAPCPCARWVCDGMPCKQLIGMLEALVEAVEDSETAQPGGDSFDAHGVLSLLCNQARVLIKQSESVLGSDSTSKE